MSKSSTQRLKREFFGGTGIVKTMVEAHAFVVEIFYLFSVSLSIVPSCCQFILDCMESIGWWSFVSALLVMGRLIGFVDLVFSYIGCHCVCVCNQLYLSSSMRS